MARQKKRNYNGRRKKVLGAIVLVLSLVLLISLISNSQLDNARITGDLDSNLNPFEIKYRNQAGMFGAYLSYSLTVLLGWLAYFLPLGCILLALRLLSSTLATRLELNSFLLFVISIMGTVIYNVHHLVNPTIGYETGAIGGWVGTHLTLVSIRLVGELGSYVVAGGLILILLMTYTSITPLLSMRFSLPGAKLLRRTYDSTWQLSRSVFSFKWILSLWRRQHEELANDQEPGDSVSYELGHEPMAVDTIAKPDTESEPEEVLAIGNKSIRKKAVIKRSSEPVRIESVDYTGPSLDLLETGDTIGPAISPDELNMTARMLRETLETFQVTIDGPIDKYPGPIITRFEFKPAAGVKINRIVSLADDLALALKAKRIRIVAPIPGKAAVGIEIPNRNPQMVYLKEIIGSEQFADDHLILPLALGKTISGRPFMTDLAKMPHLLVAGATGSGKSVCMNAIITSLIFRLHPVQVRFIFIDPKMLELSIYGGIPHLGRPVITSPKRAERVLADIVVEMESRYRKLANASVRNIEDFNHRQKQTENRLPYIVICVDELADLMMAATSSKIEALITRLAQMARAVGIHLVLATQRPSVDVITGLIKANFPARIAFQVSSKVDSRTIIDANGAEKLLGAGDMLFLNSGQPEPVRIHGAFISSEDTERLVKFITDQGLEMMALGSISQETGDMVESNVELGDPLFREACEVVIRHKQGSVSLLQRRLGIGYQRAARLIDRLEQAGVVSPFDGSKARDVMVDQTYLQTMFGEPSKVAEAGD